MTKLTEKQKKFADEYVKTGNISGSYKIAYPSVNKDSAARASGSRLLTKAKGDFIRQRYKPANEVTV